MEAIARGVRAPEPVATLIQDLDSREELVREHARQKLVAFGPHAAPALADALEAGGDRLRWEAAKALCEIHDPRTAESLVRALDDANAEVRWIAAEALSVLGPGVAAPLLRRLVTHSDSVWLRDGAHHVFSQLSRRPDMRSVLRPAVEALEGIAPRVGVMAGAVASLRRLEQAGYR